MAAKRSAGSTQQRAEALRLALSEMLKTGHTPASVKIASLLADGESILRSVPLAGRDERVASAAIHEARSRFDSDDRRGAVLKLHAAMGTALGAMERASPKHAAKTPVAVSGGRDVLSKRDAEKAIADAVRLIGSVRKWRDPREKTQALSHIDVARRHLAFVNPSSAMPYSDVLYEVKRAVRLASKDAKLDKLLSDMRRTNIVTAERVRDWYTRAVDIAKNWPYQFAGTRYGVERKLADAARGTGEERRALILEAMGKLDSEHTWGQARF